MTQNYDALTVIIQVILLKRATFVHALVVRPGTLIINVTIVRMLERKIIPRDHSKEIARMIVMTMMKIHHKAQKVLKIVRKASQVIKRILVTTKTITRVTITSVPLLPLKGLRRKEKTVWTYLI